MFSKSMGGEHHLTNIHNDIARKIANEILQCSLTNSFDHYAPWHIPLATVNNIYNIFIKSGKHDPPLVK
jgi:hypothetical protein